MTYQVIEPPYDPQNISEYLSRELRRIEAAFSQKKVFQNGVLWTTGRGSPEGVIAAPIGSIYSRIDGGTGTAMYVKESGSGNTGWVAK